MAVLIACEESQTVCKAFRVRGIEAYSCDILEPSGGHPEWHILGNALEAIKGGSVTTMDGLTHDVGRWELLIAHPPCTFLSNVAGIHYSLDYRSPEYVVERWKNRALAAVFFMQFFNANAERIAIENPVGFMNSKEDAKRAIKQNITRMFERWESLQDDYSAGLVDGCKTDMEAFDAIPAADVEPVRREKWEETALVEIDNHGEIYRIPDAGLRCPYCMCAFDKKLLWRRSYCPNCGAKMENER